MNLSRDSETVSEIYLSDISPRDKPWDVHRCEASQVETLYRDSIFDRLAERMGQCSGYLEFGSITDPETAEISFKLQNARFCRVRHCPVCQWRKSLMWFARLAKAMPAIREDFPKARWIFLTLTVKNCALEELRETLSLMGSAWQRLVQRKSWPALGFVRSMEVTRSPDGTVHPHYHALLMVKPSYFSTGYLSQARWAELWQEALRSPYKPIVDVRTLKANSKRLQSHTDPNQGILDNLLEVCKYSVKPSDLLSGNKELDRIFLTELTSQLHKTRSVTLGGVIRNYLSESEPEDLIGEEKIDGELLEASYYFGWREVVSRYLKVEPRNST